MQRLFKTHMADDIIFKNSRLPVKKFQVIITVVDERVDGEITHAERSQVLKKVSALAGVNTVIFDT